MESMKGEPNINPEKANEGNYYYDCDYSNHHEEAEYPDIGDQLVMIYHNGDGGATFQAVIKAVKDKYPKE